MESYDKIKKVLALGFMNFLDENKPKDKMCLSIGECADIEEAFNEQDWPKLERYLDKYTESEDERIRKAIIELLKEVEEDETYTGRQHIPEMLAYLEKQKEQKPNIELIQRSWYMEGYHDREFGKEPMWIIKTEEGGPKHELNPKYGQPLADEQMPAECINIEELAKHIKAEFESFRNLLKKKGIDYQPTDVYWTDYARLFVSSAKKLQKPTEWSEEDEKHINLILRVLDIQQCWDGATGKKFNPYQDEIDWLKSLRPRPSWKPSEEQMEALLWCIAPLGGTYRRVLTELHEQLKKL